MLWLKENNQLYVNLDLPECDNRRSNINSQSNSDINVTTTDIEECIAVEVDEHVPIESRSPMNLQHVRLPRVTGNIVNAYEIPSGEEMCFPWLFPYGKSGYTDVRQKDSMFPNMYPKARFLGKDDRFRKRHDVLVTFCKCV